jgi:hypothetical protein
MGALAQLSQSTVDVDPGRSATIGMTVRNNGTVVDRYTFEALGAAAAWVTFAPNTLSLFPEASATVNIILSPPRDPLVTAGPTPLGVRVVSAEDEAGSVVEEGTVNVGAFSDITVELVPRVARGRLVGRAQLAVDNRSNCRYRAEIVGSDSQMQLAFAFRPPMVDVAPGEAVFSKVAIRPAQRFWRGPEKTRPFRLVLRQDLTSTLARVGTLDTTPSTKATGGAGEGGGAAGVPTPPEGTPAVSPTPVGGPADASVGAPSPHRDEIFADGSMLQQPMLPRWLLAVAAAVVALALILALLWFVLFKPQIRSTAQNQVNKQLTANGITPVSTSGGNKSGNGSGSGGSSPGGGGSGGGSSTASTTPPGGTSSNVPGSGATINGVAQASGNGTRVIFTVPAGRSLQITDILVENSAGDTGNLALARSGIPVMQWSMANFRDLDYHWITPTVFGARTQMQLIVSGCTGACTPGIYYAGHLVSG